MVQICQHVSITIALSLFSLDIAFISMYTISVPRWRPFVMGVMYKGVAGKVIAEKSIEGIHFTTWDVLLVTGRIVRGPMYHFTIVGMSVLDELKATPIEMYRDIP